MSERRPPSPEPNKPQDKLRPASRLLELRNTTENRINTYKYEAEFLCIEDLGDDLQAFIEDEKKAVMVLTLEFALGERGDDNDKPFINDPRNIPTRPASEVREAKEILKRKLEKNRKNSPVMSFEEFSNRFSTDPRILALVNAEGKTGELEAFDYVLGNDNAVADLIKPSPNQ